MAKTTKNEKKPIFPPPWDWIIALGTRIVVWGLLFGVLYLLRSFFSLVFLTFVFTYVQTRGVPRLDRRIKLRSIRVTCVAAMFLGVLVGIGVFIVPRVLAQTALFGSQFSTYLETIDRSIYTLTEAHPFLSEIIPEIDSLRPVNGEGEELVKWNAKKSPTATALSQLFGLGDETAGQQNIKELADALGNVGSRLFTVVSNFVLALLFSFLIVLDLPKLHDGVTSLENTKLKFIYVEVADNIRDFAVVLGRALEAQLMIAIFNTLFTAVGIYLLGLGAKVAFLSVIVFLCSFIPVVGVFISSVPICLVALQISGFNTVLFAILLVTVVHLIEGYVLNPKIYGSHLRINPVIVLIILTIGGTLFHIWGLILGVPICTYIFGHAILTEDKRL